MRDGHGRSKEADDVTFRFDLWIVDKTEDARMVMVSLGQSGHLCHMETDGHKKKKKK